MASRRGNVLFRPAGFRQWRLSGKNSRVFRSLAAAAAIVTCAALGTKSVCALGDANGTPPSQIVVVDPSTYPRPAPARVWRRVTEAEPTIQRAVDSVSWEGVLAKIQMLVDFGPRMECSRAMLSGAVPESLAVFFRGLDLDVALEKYYLAHWNYCDQHPTGLNVIATQRGVDYPDSIFVISAHYDSYRGPGADDNATGVAAVMTAAELLSRHRFAYTIQYICFGNEEYCGCGSLDFVARAYRDHVNLVGALNFDMLGYWREGAVFDLEVEANAPSAWLAEAFVNAAGLYTDTPCDTHITDIVFSDNGSFWRFGYAALNNEEAWMGHEGDFNPHWHKKDDLIQYLHPGFTVACTRAAVAGIATLARFVPPIRALVDISPKALNPNSEGRWITGRIELPAEYDPWQVDVSSIRLNETVAADPHPAAVGDADRNGDPDLLVKFSRIEVVGVLGQGESAQLSVSGLVGGEYFEGCDTIRVVGSAGREEWAVADSEFPRHFELFQNFPNPFNPTTTISFALPEKTRAVLSIHDVAGRLVTKLIDDALDEGPREIVWDGKDASGREVGSGVYLYRLTAGGNTLTKKMVLIR